MTRSLVIFSLLLIVAGHDYWRNSKKDEDTSLIKLLSSDKVGKRMNKPQPTHEDNDNNVTDNTVKPAAKEDPTNPSGSDVSTTHVSNDAKADVIDSSVNLSSSEGITNILSSTNDQSPNDHPLNDQSPNYQSLSDLTDKAALNDILAKISSNDVVVGKPISDSALEKELISNVNIPGELAVGISSTKNNDDNTSPSSSDTSSRLSSDTSSVTSDTSFRISSDTSNENNTFEDIPPHHPHNPLSSLDDFASKKLAQLEQHNSDVSQIKSLQAALADTSKLTSQPTSKLPPDSSTPKSPSKDLSNLHTNRLHAYNLQDLSMEELNKMYSNIASQPKSENDSPVLRQLEVGKPTESLLQLKVNSDASGHNNVPEVTLHYEPSEMVDGKKREEERHEATILNNPKPKTDDSQAENIDINVLKALADIKGKTKGLENLAPIEENVLLGNQDEGSSKSEKIQQHPTSSNRTLSPPESNKDTSEPKDKEISEGDKSKDTLNSSESVKDKDTSSHNKDLTGDNADSIISSRITTDKFPIIIIKADDDDHRKPPDVENLPSKDIVSPPTEFSDNAQSVIDKQSLEEEYLLSEKLNYLKDKLRQRKRQNHMHELKLAELERKIHPLQFDTVAGDTGGEMSHEQTLESQNSSMLSLNDTVNDNAQPPQQRQTENAAIKISANDIPSSDIKDSPRLVMKNVTNVGRVRGKMVHANPAVMFSFSYDPSSPFGPPSWQLLNQEWTCKGRKQSPINIETDRVTEDQIVKNVVLKIYPPEKPISGMLKNNGHAPTFSLSKDVSVRLFGGTLGNNYFLRQLHFHFGCDSSLGSEHRIDGMVFPLELHLVFWDNTTYTTFPEAAKADRGIAVISILYQVESVTSSDMRKTPLAQFVQLTRRIEEEGDNITVTEEFNFKLERLLPNVISPDRADRFFTYEGSLSTPGCYESVTWIVYTSHPAVTEAQLRIFRNLKSTKVNSKGLMCNNSRPVQNKNGRRIYTNVLS